MFEATLGAPGLPIRAAKQVNAPFTKSAPRLGKRRRRLAWEAMAGPPRRNARSGGALLALSIVAGAVGGTIGGQPSMGFLAGTAAGLIMLLAVWLVDRRR
jgi:hypothetical protein